LVDVIAAGHTHAGLAHQVNGIAIIESFSRGQAFGRVDVVVDQRTGRVAQIELFAPRDICAQEDPKTHQCVPGAASAVPARYEGRRVRPDSAVVKAMAPALQRVRDLQATTLGVSVDVRIRRAGDLGSPLGNLFADALREAVPGADVAVVNNATRGLRADLPDGPMTFGRLYDVFPFDNRLSRITLAGAELTRWLSDEIRQGRRRGLGISGVRVRADCSADGIRVELFRPSALRIHDEDQLVVVTIGSPTPSGTLASTVRRGSSNGADNAPVVREVVENWLRQPRRRLGAGEAEDADHRRWDFAGTQPDGCLAPNGLE
jgi:5'-nucleotidase